MKKSRLAILFSCIMTSVLFGNEIKLWYQQPSKDTSDALLIGNGHLGAIIEGQVALETIRFNEETLWTGGPSEYNKPDACKSLPQFNKLIAEGQTDQASDLFKNKILDSNYKPATMLPFGIINLEFPGHEKFTDYRRGLDLNTAITTISYIVDEIMYKREIFATAADDAIVVRLTASDKAKINFNVSLDTDLPNAEYEFVDNSIILQGQLDAPDTLKYYSILKVDNQGGSITANDKQLQIKSADSVTIILTASTSFKHFKSVRGKPDRTCKRVIEAISEKDYASIKRSHLHEYQRLFNRVEFDLGPMPEIPTDQWLNSFSDETVDPAYWAFCFQYYRYLIIAGSRVDTQPMFLDNLWHPSKARSSIGLVGTYSCVEVANLSECHYPLIDMIEEMTETGAIIAEQMYGISGWVNMGRCDIWRYCGPDNVDSKFALRIAESLWEHYDYERDEEYLAMRGYGPLTEATRFYTELSSKTDTDISLAYDFLSGFVHASRILDRDEQLRIESERVIAGIDKQKIIDRNYSTDYMSNLFKNLPTIKYEKFIMPYFISNALIYSNFETVELLPALPKQWPDGSIKGICARGGFVVDMQWQSGELVKASIRATKDEPLILKYKNKTVKLQTKSRQRYDFDGQLHQIN
ncbi:MAG: glycoside hydrolase family 95 protein [Phycisphaerae bacterium]|nr:glycoside hydrolase family 95 protein [Phycisphaerae bacterium]